MDGYQILRRVAEARVAELGRIAREYFTSADGLVPIGRAELIERARTGDVIILDVRPSIEYENGHIAGAISIPVMELEACLMAILNGRAPVWRYRMQRSNQHSSRNGLQCGL